MKAKHILSLLLCTTLSLQGWAEEAVSDSSATNIHVIVNQDSQLTTLNKKQVMSLFLGRARNFPSGIKAKPLDNKIGSTIRQQFFESLTGKSIADIDAYWARLRYSGRASPPKEIEGAEQLLKEVSSSKHAIAYIRASDADQLNNKGIIVVHSIEGQ